MLNITLDMNSQGTLPSYSSIFGTLCWLVATTLHFDNSLEFNASQNEEIFSELQTLKLHGGSLLH